MVCLQLGVTKSSSGTDTAGILLWYCWDAIVPMKVRVGSRCAARIVVVMVELKKGGATQMRGVPGGYQRQHLQALAQQEGEGDVDRDIASRWQRLCVWQSWCLDRVAAPSFRAKQAARRRRLRRVARGRRRRRIKGKEPSALTFRRVWDDDLLFLLQIGVTQ